ncbi:hypothetical protein ACQY0O_005368 [Thecaphora frezii]
MTFSPFEVTSPHIIYVGLGAFVCIFSYLSLFIKERLYLGEAPIAAAFGIIVGPVAIGLFNPAKWGGESGETPGGHVTDEVTLEVMRVTIALSVFAVGVELPKKYLLRHWRSIAILLGPVMAWGWLITGLLIWALVPGLDYLTSLVIAACVSPTDPILAQAVVGGPWAEKHVPAHVRHMLMCESGCNDGAAFPFLYLALYLTQNRDNAGYAIGRWFYETWAYEIILGTLLGALIGYAARKFMRFSERHKLIDRESFVAQYVSLAIVSMGVNVLLGSDDLLAAFACGTAFAWDGWFTKQTEDSNFSNIIDLLFNVATFIYIGALIPWHDFANAAIGLSVWRLVVLTILVLLLKRIPIMLAMWKWIPDIKTFREAVFSGHFGPMGVGAIFIATLGRTLMPEEVPEHPETAEDVLANVIQPIVYFFVLCSIVVHGLTIPFFAFGKNAHRRAHTLTRTWSRNPSMAAEEPGWMSRVRRVRTGEDIVINTDDISAEKMTAAELAMIGRGAIGGPIEDELRHETSGESTAGGSNGGVGGGEDDSSGRTGGSLTGLLNRKTELDLEKAEGGAPHRIHGQDDYEDDYDDLGYGGRQAQGRNAEMDGVEDWDYDEPLDPSCDYLGDNCAEVKRWRAQMAAKRQAKAAQGALPPPFQQGAADAVQEQDLGEAPMDRDLISGRIDPSEEDEAARLDREGQSHAYHDGTDAEHRGASGGLGGADGEWPKLREWVEGNKLVLEYQRSYSDDPEVHVIDLSDEESESLAEADSPSHRWLQQNKFEVGRVLGSEKHHDWSPAEAAHRLIEHGIPCLWGNKKRRTSQGGSGGAGNAASAEAKHGAASGGKDGEAPCESLDELHQRLEAADKGTRSRSPEPQLSRSHLAAIDPPEESQAERDERAAMLYGAMAWARDNRDHDEPLPALATAADVAGGRGSPSQIAPSSVRARPKVAARRSSSSTSRSPPPPADAQQQQQQPLVSVGALGSKRFSLRKKVLSGQIGLSGRKKGARRGSRSRGSPEALDEEDDDEDAEESASTSKATRPTVVVSPPQQQQLSRTPTRERRGFIRLGQKVPPAKGKADEKEKYFPRSASAGAGLADDGWLRSLARGGGGEASNSGSGRLSVRGTGAGASGSLSTASSSGTTRSHNRHSSIQWLDVATGSGAASDAAFRQAHGPGTPTRPTRPRAHSSASSSRTATPGESASADHGDAVSLPTDPDPGSHGESGEATTNFAERGKNRIVNFFTNFTAPKGEGMGNPGPISHPHLFPDEAEERARRQQAAAEDGGGDEEKEEGGGRLRVPEGHEVRYASSAPMGTGTGTGTGTTASRVMIDMPHDDEPPVPAGRW